MPINHREIAFEDAIEHHLFNVAGYTMAAPANLETGETGRKPGDIHPNAN